MNTITRRIAVTAVAVAAGAVALTGCSSSSSGGSSSSPAASSKSASSETPIGSPSPTPEGGLCSESAISAFVEKAQPGAKVDHFECVKVDNGQVAAVQITNGGLVHVIFLQDEANSWVEVNKDVCNGDAEKSDSKFAELCKQA